MTDFLLDTAAEYSVLIAVFSTVVGLVVLIQGVRLVIDKMTKKQD